MTIINPNSISGITSFTAEADVMNFYRSNGTLGSLQLNGCNFNTTNGISTFNNLNVGGTLTYEDVKNVDSVGIISARTAIHVGAGISAVGIITGTSFRGDGSQLTGITGTTINNNANNRIITGSGTANTLEAEATLLWDGTDKLTTYGASGYPTLKFECKTGGGSYEWARFIGGGSGLRIANTNFSANASGDELILGTTNNSRGITIASGNSSGNSGNIFFADSGSNTAGRISYEQDNDEFVFYTGTTERTRITASGVITKYDTRNVSIRNASGSTRGHIQASGNGIDIQSHVNSNGFITFSTNGGATPAERLRITSDGKVGINETSPDFALHVKTTTDVEQLKVENSASSGRAQVRFVNPHGDWVVGTIGGTTEGDFITYTADAKNFRVYTSNDEKLRIDSSGRLLLGTTTEGHADADDLTIATSGSTGITLRSATNGAGSIFFSDGTSGTAEYDCFLQFYHTSRYFCLGINNDEKLRVTSGGTLILGDSNAASASGLIHLYQASNDPYIYIQRGSGDSATTIGGIFFKNSSNALGLISVRSSDINDGSMKFSTMNAGTLGEKLIIQPSGNLDVYANTVHLYNNTDTSNTYFYAQNTAAGNAGIKMKNNQGEWTIIANDRLRFIDDDASSERLSIENDGNVKVWNGGRITILSANNNGQTTTLLKIGSQGNGSETRAIDIDGNWSDSESKSITYTHGSGATNMVAQMNVQYTNPGSQFRWGKLYHSGDSSTYTMYLKSISTTKAELGVYGRVVVNSNPSSYIPLACQPTQGGTGCFIGQSQAYNTAYSLLPWTNGGTYISSGVYYDNSSWVHRSQGTTNCLLYFKGSGWDWYSSNNSSASWNVANSVSVMNSSGEWTGGTSSDRRLKDNITNMSTSDALTKVSQLQGVSYTWKDEVQKKFGTGPYPEGTHYGFIAQDVKTVWPEAHIITQIDNESDFDEDPTHDVKDDVYYGEIEGVKMEKMVPLLVEAIKELKKENDALKARVTTLESS